MRGVRVIFLDIDGVLNCKKTPNPRDLPYIIDSRLLRIFLRMVGRTRAKVVLISDWRHDPAGLFSARYWGIPYVDIVPYLPKRSRGEQILHENKSVIVHCQESCADVVSLLDLTEQDDECQSGWNLLRSRQPNLGGGAPAFLAGVRRKRRRIVRRSRVPLKVQGRFLSRHLWS